MSYAVYRGARMRYLDHVYNINMSYQGRLLLWGLAPSRPGICTERGDHGGAPLRP